MEFEGHPQEGKPSWYVTTHQVNSAWPSLRG